MRLNKRVIRATVAALCLVLVTQAAQAWIFPALGVAGRFFSAPLTNTVMWLGRAAASNPVRAKAWEWSIALHGGILGALWFGDSDPDLNVDIVEASFIVTPENDTQTVNPDPERFDNTPSPSDPLQPSPKQSFSSAKSSITKPSTYADIVKAIGGAGESQWYQNTVNQDIRYLAVRAPDYVNNGSTYLNSCNAPALSTIPTGYDTKAWCGNVTGVANPGNYQVYYDIRERTCPQGYTISSGNCILSDAQQVMKPDSTVACEITRKSSGTWYIDPKNPECANLASAITQSADGKKITISNGAGQTATVTENADLTRDYDFQNGDTWRNIKTGPYDPGLGGRPITSITDGGGTNPGGTAGTPGSGSGGTGTGSGGSCGGSGQPACVIDDSGFDGKATDGDGLTGKVDTHDQSIKDRLAAINPADKHGMEWTWLPSIPRVACTPFEFGTAGKTMTIDMCSTFAVIRQALGWLLYIFMAWGLFDLLMSGTTTKGRK